MVTPAELIRNEGKDPQVLNRVDLEPQDLASDAVLKMLLSADLQDLDSVDSLIAVVGSPDPELKNDAVENYRTTLELTALDDVQRAVRQYTQYSEQPWEGDPWLGWMPGLRTRSGRTELRHVEHETWSTGTRNMVSVINTYVAPFCGPRIVDAAATDRVTGPAPAALSAQLFNLLADGIDSRRCANENCTTFFSRQEGRAKHDQHRRTGIKYCSQRCARAQSARERRREKRAEGS